ncbi:SMI1/KNR4 family protein [Janthinobacterium sp. RB2P8]|uniref:SMI1/KNR4 family protein n=1 Tax=Janthinobacterium sp. RB2P8 TaxID=3424191 RepID=UPI003F21921E
MTYYTQYRHLALEGAKPAPTEQQIAAIETLLEAPLPPAFLAFLQVANGAWFDYTTDVPDGNGGVEQMGFNTFFSADEGDFCDETLVGEIRAARQHTDMPVRILPFARDGGNSMVYLDLTEEGAGRVLAYVQELPEWTGKRAHGFIELAPSFDAWLDSLYIDRDTVLDELEHSVSEPAHLEAMAQWLDIGMPAWRRDAGITALFALKQVELCANEQD